MKKILLGMAAMFALSVAVPAFATDNEKEDAEKKEDKAPSPEKTAKKPEKK